MNVQNNCVDKYNSIYLDILSYCCGLIASAENQELIYHSQGAVHWSGILSKNPEKITVDSIKPKDRRLEIAAFAHEIERAFSNRLDPYNFQSFYLYKHASTIRSAEILERILTNHNLDFQNIKFITDIILGSVSDSTTNENAIILREADVLSFFKISLPNFFVHKISDKILQEICINEFKKLTDRGRKYLFQVNFSDVRMKYYLDSIINSVS